MKSGTQIKGILIITLAISVILWVHAIINRTHETEIGFVGPTLVACNSRAGLPDPKCTPGKIDPSVTQDNIKQTICVSGYTAKIRPPTSYTTPLKLRQMTQYGRTGDTSDYEEDHLIPLELGGDPTSELNLWPESPPSPNEKDHLENVLKSLVCRNQITLKEAQDAISSNWLTAYQKYVK